MRELSFTKSGDFWQSEFAGSGHELLQIKREAPGSGAVQVRIGDLPYRNVISFYAANEVCEINYPAEVQIRIISTSAVTGCKAVSYGDAGSSADPAVSLEDSDGEVLYDSADKPLFVNL